MDSKAKYVSKKFLIIASLVIIIIVALYLRFLFVYKVVQPPLSGDAKNYDIMVKQFLTKGLFRVYVKYAKCVCYSRISFISCIDI